MVLNDIAAYFAEVLDRPTTVESGLRHPLPNMNRQDVGFTAMRPNHKTMFKTYHFSGTNTTHSDVCSTAPGQSLVPTSNSIHNFTPSKLSRLNASLIERRSVDNERGHGLGLLCHSYTGSASMSTCNEYKYGVSDNWCHAC
jgi:hypothetical protein